MDGRMDGWMSALQLLSWAIPNRYFFTEQPFVVLPDAQLAAVAMLLATTSCNPNCQSYICEVALSPQSCALFADLIFQSAPPSSFVLTCRSANQTLNSTVLRVFCRQLSQIALWNRGNMLRRPQKPHYSTSAPKHAGLFAREWFLLCIYTFPNGYTSQLL